MKKIVVVIGILWCSQVNAFTITSHGGWSHTSNSNYGDSATIDTRLEQPLFGDLSVALEGAYHGKQSHFVYGDLSGFSLLGEVVYSVHSSSKIMPYILGGLGWSRWNFDRSQDMKDKGIQINMGNALAEKVGIGANYAINRNWSINLEWDYFHTDVPKDSFYESDHSFANVVGSKTVGQEETNLVVGLSYKF